MSKQEREKLLSNNPVLAAQYFVDRFIAFLQEVILHQSKFNDYCDVVDFWFRLEFQARGSLHAHAIAWTDYFKNAIEKLKTDEGKLNITDILKSRIRAEANFKKSVTGENLSETFNPEVCYPTHSTTDNTQKDECPFDGDNKCNPNFCIHKVHNAKRFDSCYVHPGCRFANTSPAINKEEYYFDSNELIKVFLNHNCCDLCYKGQKHLPDDEKYCRYKYPKEGQPAFEVLLQPTVNELGEDRFKLEVLPKRVTDKDCHTVDYMIGSLRTWRANMDVKYICNPWYCI